MSTVNNGKIGGGANAGVVRRRARGFTLVEVLVSATLLSTGVVAVLAGFGALSRSEARARELETMQRLAYEKYDEVLSTSQDISAPDEGDFSDENYPGYTWRSESEVTGVENLEAVTVTVEKSTDKSESAPVATATGLVYVPPQGSTGAAQ